MVAKIGTRLNKLIDNYLDSLLVLHLCEGNEVLFDHTWMHDVLLWENFQTLRLLLCNKGGVFDNFINKQIIFEEI